MYLETGRKEECCGCKACGAVCPIGAVTFETDEEGFEYPSVNAHQCVGCGMCVNACSFATQTQLPIRDVFAAWNTSPQERGASSSGGIFVPLALHAIDNGGAVAGAVFAEDFSVRHIVTRDTTILDGMRRSKYVQSDCLTVFEGVREELKRKRPVLFSGTPCQIAALKGVLGVENEYLITCEVICFGVPSPKVYDAYRKWLEDKYRSRICRINFKDKRYGWDYYTTCINFDNGNSVCRFGGDSYSRFMHLGWSLRPSCLTCPFDVHHSMADISLGDFYSIGQYTATAPPKSGVSCVIIRTPKGERLFSEISGVLFIEQVDSSAFSSHEVKVEKNCSPTERERFFVTLDNEGYSEAIGLLPKETLTTRVFAAIQGFRMEHLRR